MSWLKNLFSSSKQPAEKSPWELTVVSMRDKELDCFDGVQEAVYSKDGSRRFVLLRSEDCRYRYEYQELTACSQEELDFFAQMGKEETAYWSIDCTKSESAGFFSLEDARRQMQEEKHYKKHF